MDVHDTMIDHYQSHHSAVNSVEFDAIGGVTVPLLGVWGALVMSQAGQIQPTCIMAVTAP